MHAEFFANGRSRALSQQLSARLLASLDLTSYPVKTAPAGCWLHRSGQVMHALPCIESGRLDAIMSLSGDGSQVIPVTFGAGELALLSALFSREAPRVDFVVADALRYRSLPVTVIEAALLADKELLLLLVRFLSQRLREVRSRERGWLERGVPQRVRIGLARVVLEHPPLPDGPWLVKATHEHLALRCGVSRPKLSVEVKQLERTGCIRLHRGAIEVIDYAKLVRDV